MRSNVTLLLLTLFFNFYAQAETHLFLIGGGPRPQEAMEAFVKTAGGSKANILICPWASGSIQGALAIQKELEAFHPQSVEILPQYSRKKNFLSEFRKQTETATGIFFTGGNQNRLMKAITELQLKSTFQLIYENGIPFAGTSAGTAIMSERMLTGESDLTTMDGTKTKLTEGLGLLPYEIIVDQHFIVRQRFNRLSGLVLSQEEAFGIGIDEGTALHVINNRMAEVLGPSQVLLISKTGSNQLKVAVFSNHERFNLFDLKSLHELNMGHVR
jgi:cyanophycinase